MRYGMNFEAHFNEEDIEQAEDAFINFTGCLKLIPMYTKQGEIHNAQKVAIKMLKSLSELDKLSQKKKSGQRMYLHYLLTQPTGWYPHER